MSKNRIKGITVEINGDTTKLAKSLESVNRNISATQSELKDVERLLKLDPTNTELLSQKQKLLADTISATNEKLKTLKTASEQASQTKDNYDAWKEKYDPIKQKIGETQEKLTKLKEDAKKADEQLSKGEISQEKYDKLQSKIESTSEELKNLKQSAKDVTEEFGNPISSQQYNALQREIIETEQELKNLQNQANDSSGFDNLQQEISETSQDLDNLQQETENSSSKLSAVGEKMQSAGEKVEGVGKALMPVTGAIGVGFTYAVKTTADFDSQMSKVSAISGATGDDLQDLRDKAREMGSQTKYSASEAGQAFEYMAMAGWKTDEMLGGIEGIMNLAAASGEELATTSDIVTDALTALGMSAKDSGHFADVLAAASSNANTNVSMLGESFKYVAPVAGSMGASAEDLSLALGLMANSGIKGTQAGNSLKNALVNLTKPTKAQAEAMQKLGFISTETVQSIDFGKVEKAEKDVENATLNLDSAQVRLNDAIEKYGEGSSQAQIASNNYEKAQNALAQAQSNLEKEQAGVTKQIAGANTLMTDENGNMRSLGEVMEELRKKMGGVNVALTDADGNAREFDDIVSELSTTTEGLAQAEQLQAAATIFGKQNMSGMLAIINASEKDYNSLKDAIYDCDDTAKNMAETMQDNLDGQLTILKSQLQELAISFGEILMPAIRAIVSKIQQLADKFNGLSTEHKELITKIALVVAAVAPVLIVIGKVISSVGTILTIIPKISSALGIVVGAVVKAVSTAGTALLSVFKLVASGIQSLFSLLLANPIVLVITAIVALVAGFVYLWNNCEAFRQFWIGLWESIQDTLYSFFDAWVAGWNAIKEFFASLWDSIMEGMYSFYDAVVNAWNSLTTAIKNIVTALKLAVISIWTTLRTAVSNAMITLKKVIVSVWNTIRNAVVNTAVGIKNGIVNGFTAAINWIKGLASSAWNWGADIIDGIINGITSKVTDLVNSVKDVANSISEYLHFSVPDKGPLASFEEWMPDFMNGLADGIKRNKAVVEKAVKSVAEAMQMTVQGDLSYSPIVNSPVSAGTVNNYYTNNDNSQTINQTNNSPKALSRLEIYRQTRNLINTVKRG